MTIARNAIAVSSQVLVHGPLTSRTRSVATRFLALERGLMGFGTFRRASFSLGKDARPTLVVSVHKGSPGREVAVRLRDLLSFRFYRSASPGLVRLFAIHVKL